MAGISDDEIIKRKLLLEGESGNDDRRITLLLKNYLRWISMDDADDLACHETFQTLLNSVYQSENAMEQSNLVLEMNAEQQQQHYQRLYSDIESEMVSARKRIEKLKADLKAAKVVRKNRREFNSVAKIISQHPARSDTLAKYTKLKNQLESLQKLNEEYDQKIALRKKQFHLFLFSLRGLQKLIEADDASGQSIIDSPSIAASASGGDTQESQKMDTT